MSLVLKTPSTSIVRHYLKKWDNLEGYSTQEQDIRELFDKTWPRNTDFSQIAAKVALLDACYSTHVGGASFDVARHILNIGIDSRIESGDITLVDEIAGGEGLKRHYSFASKYCAHHSLDAFPIYDSFVDEMLWHFNQRDNFADFRRKDLKDYTFFVSAYNQFISFYGLTEFIYREIDAYLWMAGKEAFK